MTDTFADVDAGPTGSDISLAQQTAAPAKLQRPVDHESTTTTAARPMKLKKQESLRQLHKMASIRNDQRQNDALLLKLRGLIGMDKKDDRLISNFNPDKK